MLVSCKMLHALGREEFKFLKWELNRWWMLRALEGFLSDLF